MKNVPSILLGCVLTLHSVSNNIKTREIHKFTQGNGEFDY